MRTLYYDSEFKCHTTNPDGIFQEFETEFFDGKCDTFVGGYVFIPDDETWTREDGKTFAGRRIFPWKDYSELDAAQREHEKQMLADYKAACERMGIVV